MCDTCGDNRFELIEKYKQKLLDATNIEDSPEEMAVIDNILFRFWQMGWLKGELFGISEQLELDTISRAAVVDAIEGVDWYHINKNGEMVHGANDNDHQAWYKAEDIYKAVESVLSAQPRWIPCKTALPEKRKYVLCQCRAGIMDVLRLTDDNDWYKDSTHIYMHSFVVAWRPLPEPWKGEQHGTSRAVLSQKPMR